MTMDTHIEKLIPNSLSWKNLPRFWNTGGTHAALVQPSSWVAGSSSMDTAKMYDGTRNGTLKASMIKMIKTMNNVGYSDVNDTEKVISNLRNVHDQYFNL